jgi:uncharacterized RDD family membrane protein YckC
VRVTSPHRSADLPAHRGSKYGLPERGPGSVAGWRIRIAALLIDWVLANLAAVALTQTRNVWSAQSWLGWTPFIVWFVEVWLSTGLSGASVGQHVLRLAVLRLDHQPVGLVRAFIRTALLALIIPPLVFDRDGRGLHDMAAGTIVVRGPGTPLGRDERSIAP